MTERKIRTLADAYAERPPREYIVDGFFSAASLNIVYGSPGGYKSLIMADCMACVVAGSDWLPGALGNGGEGIKTRQSPVYWLDLDNGSDTSDERIEAVARARNLPIDAPFYYESMPNPPYNLTEVDDAIELILTARDQLQARMIVIDNLGLIAGDVEENTARMAHVMGTLRDIAERTRAAVVVIHHQRKSNGSGPAAGRVGETLRGHSSIEASLDLALLVMRDGSGQEVIIKHTKSRHAEPPQVAAKFYYTHKPGTNELETAWFSGAPAITDDEAMRAAVIDVLLSNGNMGRGRLIEKTRERVGPSAYGIKKTRELISEMVAGGILDETRKGRDAIVGVSNGQSELDFTSHR